MRNFTFRFSSKIGEPSGYMPHSLWRLEYPFFEFFPASRHGALTLNLTLSVQSVNAAHCSIFSSACALEQRPHFSLCLGIEVGGLCFPLAQWSTFQHISPFLQGSALSHELLVAKEHEDPLHQMKAAFCRPLAAELVNSVWGLSEVLHTMPSSKLIRRELGDLSLLRRDFPLIDIGK